MLIKCYSGEIDGYAFYKGLKKSKIALQDSDAQSRVRSAAYLLKGAALRPKHLPRHQDRFSLDIRTLGELVDMCHNHKATDPRDKVYALLGMSSDDHIPAGLLPNYDIEWKDLFHRLVNSILDHQDEETGQASVKTWTNPELALIEGKGCVLGKVSSVAYNKQQVFIDSGPEKEWTLGPSAEIVRSGDLIIRLRGASKHMIVRPCKDHFSVVLISVTPPKTTSLESEHGRQSEQSVPCFPYHFRLFWRWETSRRDVQDREKHVSLSKGLANASDYSNKVVESHMAEEIRLWNVVAILKKADHEEAELRVQELRVLDSGVLTEVLGYLISSSRHPKSCERVLTAVCLAHRALSLSELAINITAGLPVGVNVETFVEECGSVFISVEEGVCLIDPLAKNCLMNRLQSVGITLGHDDVSRSSIRAMYAILKQNIYNLSVGFKQADVKPPQPDPLAPIRYSCVAWVEHLLYGEHPMFIEELIDEGPVLAFLKQRFLYWLESLSLLGKLSEGMLSITQLLIAAQVCSNASVSLQVTLITFRWRV
jgi:hypothetical protein